jgi:hypothetical protein
MQAKPCHINTLLAGDPSSFQKRPREWRWLWFERFEDLGYVTWIRRGNPVRNVRIVNGRLSSRYVVRGFGFCDLNSPDISRRALVLRTIGSGRGTSFVPIGGLIAGVPHNTEANLPMIGTNLSQRFAERTLVLPLNVCRTFLLTSNLHKGKGSCAREDCARDDPCIIAAADDRNDHDYAEYNKPESSR